MGSDGHMVVMLLMMVAMMLMMLLLLLLIMMCDTDKEDATYEDHPSIMTTIDGRGQKIHDQR